MDQAERLRWPVTAEVAIMNRTAVALAADSTVTIGGPSKRKTYNSVNKLFTLSRSHPVGAMIYGDATIMDVPWESILKEYSKHLACGSGFNTIREYADDVIWFLEKRTDIFTEARQRSYFASAAYSVFGAIRRKIDKTVRGKEDDGEKITDAVVRSVVAEVIDEWKTSAENQSILPHLGDAFDHRLAETYDGEIESARRVQVERFSLTNDEVQALTFIVARLVSSGGGPNTGLVIAGFGTNEIFPSVCTLQIYGIVLGKLVVAEDDDESHRITYDSNAALLPFAQKDVVNAFLTGCEDSYTRMIRTTFDAVADNFPTVTAGRVVDIVGPLTDDQRIALGKVLREDMVKTKEDFFKEFDGHQHQKHIKPLLDVIAALPKDELASMAEALVSLTTVKRKMSMDIETVGGPIDVAVISKGDGFVWISRKHYFKPELNPHFMDTYFKR